MYAWKRVWRLTGTPHAIAIGFAAGVAATFTPWVGFHFLTAALFAWIVGGNILASAAGTFVGNPATFPFIWLAAYNFGRFMLGKEADATGVPVQPSFDLLHSASLDTILPVFVPMVIGGLPLGVLAGLAFYFPVKSAVATYQENRRLHLERRATLSREKQRAKSEPVVPAEPVVTAPLEAGGADTEPRQAAGQN